MNNFAKAKFWAPSRILIFSFFLIIIAGTFLLMLPQATQGKALSFIDALFTSTSATCVTGLIIFDTGATFTPFGQFVILLLIQVGGLGIMTFSTFFIFLLMGKFSIAEREVIQETLTQSPIKNIGELLKSVFIFTITIEGIGALLLFFLFWERFPAGKSLYFGVFHSISAFCNAGFALFENSFMNYVGDWRLNLIIMILIILGGLGFVVLHEFKGNFMSMGKSVFSFHSKVILIVSALLIIGGAIIIFLFETKNVMLNRSLPTKFLASVFQSVTCRTAGFNTVDISLMTNTSLFFMIMLMFVGASPGSCGGGIKTSTFGVLAAMLIARFKNASDVNLLYRRVPTDVISRAISVTFFSVLIIGVATILLMVTELSGLSHQQSRGLFLETLFEVVSAFGTVGLSTGLTSGLSNTGKIIIIVTMFIGRLGPLTIALAIGKKSPVRFRYAQEKILIG